MQSTTFFHHIPFNAFKNHFSTDFAHLAHNEHDTHAKDIKNQSSALVNLTINPTSSKNVTRSLNSAGNIPVDEVTDLTNLAGQIVNLATPGGLTPASAITALDIASKTSGPAATGVELAACAFAAYQIYMILTSNTSKELRSQAYLLFVVILAIALIAAYKGIVHPIATSKIQEREQKQALEKSTRKISLLHSSLLSAIYNFMKGGDQSKFVTFLKKMTEVIVEKSIKLAKHFPEVMVTLASVVSTLIGLLSPILGNTLGTISTVLSGAIKASHLLNPSPSTPTSFSASLDSSSSSSDPAPKSFATTTETENELEPNNFGNLDSPNPLSTINFKYFLDEIETNLHNLAGAERLKKINKIRQKNVFYFSHPGEIA